ncbi:TonB-dependent receptor [Sandaracinobacteroides hominis]|uniref:TonB-dependent receptor n=1 Tax=Sandaracinobacteroides hominis TaxID=2780086 RepID=UPI0018F4582B|nr:TonB-dependent receptor [Sandaracinobacteroides hominis]
MKSKTVSGVVGLAALWWPAFAHAQETGLSDIVVTAQSRESSLATTPIPVSVMSGDELARQNIVELRDLKALAPGVTFNESPIGLVAVSVRGVGSASSNQLLEQSVGLFVDGVYHPRARQLRDALFDVERLEIIKGSQGVLFGKNTSVGAISIISRRPGDSFGGYVSGGYELEYGAANAQGALDIPLSDTVHVRMSGLYSNAKGWVENRFTGREDPRTERWVLRSMIEFDPTDELNILLKLQASGLRTDGIAFEFIQPDNPAVLVAAGVLDGGLLPFVTYNGANGGAGNPYEKQTGYDPALIITYDFANGGSLISTTSYTNYDFEGAHDTDVTPQPYIFTQFGEKFRQYSQEFRYISPADKKISYIIGGAYIHHTISFPTANNYRGFPAAPPFHLTGRVENNFKQDGDAFSLFGQLSWEINERLRFDLGARFGHEEKNGHFEKKRPDLFGDTSPTNLVRLAYQGGTRSDTIKDDTIDAAATISYNLTDSSVAYLNVGRGTKGGSFNNTTRLAQPTPNPWTLAPEKADTIEVGIKGRFLDNRIYSGGGLNDSMLRGIETRRGVADLALRADLPWRQCRLSRSAPQSQPHSH